MIAAEPLTSPIRAHEHGWITESRHTTSEGIVVYVRCIDCDARRIDLVPTASVAHAEPATRTVRSRPCSPGDHKCTPCQRHGRCNAAEDADLTLTPRSRFSVSG